jgi:TolA-binding protein
MEILLVVTTLAVGVAVLYVTATLRTRIRQNTAPLIDGAVKDISGQLETTTGELKRQLQLMADEVQRDREDTRLEERKIQGRLDHADSRLSSLASQLMVELETIRRLSEHIGVRQDQLSGDLQQLDHQVAQLSDATMQFPPSAHPDEETAAAEAVTVETVPAQADGREGPADVPGPARPADAALDSSSGPVAAGPGLG